MNYTLIATTNQNHKGYIGKTAKIDFGAGWIRIICDQVVLCLASKIYDTTEDDLRIIKTIGGVYVFQEVSKV